MAYLRPSLHPTQGNRASLTVPPGWDVVITGVCVRCSRAQLALALAQESNRDYQQVVLVEHTFFDTTTSKKLVAESRGQKMINQDVRTPSVVIKAQDENIDIFFSFYFSQNERIINRSVRQLERFRSRSVIPTVVCRTIYI